MTESDAGYIFSLACPGTDRFKIVDHQIIIVYRQLSNFLEQLFEIVLTICGHHIDSAFLSKDEAEALALVLNRIGELYVSLNATHQYVEITFLLKNGNDIARPAEMTIAGALNRI